MKVLRNTCNHVRCYHEWDQETSCVDIDSAQRSNDLASSEDKTSSNQHVRRPSIEEIREMGNCSVPGEDDFREGMGTGAIGFDLYGDEGEE